MKFFTSAWGIVIIAAVLNIGTTGGLIYLERDSFLSEAVVEAPEAPPLLWSFKANEIDQFIAELKIQRTKLDTRESDIGKLAAQQASERAELEKVRSEIQISRDELTAAVLEIQDVEAKNVKTLAQTYSGMAPPAAVAILLEMDEAMAVKILSMMKADKVGAIFQEMARAQTKDGGMTKRAARISDRLRLVKPLKTP